jgi:hypothetical protein
MALPKRYMKRRRLAGAVAPVPPVDRYTVAHGMLGYVLGIWGAPWWVALGSTLAFEFIENSIKKVAPRLFPVGTPDTWTNSLLDSGAWMTGWAVARALPLKEERAPIWTKN